MDPSSEVEVSLITMLAVVLLGLFIFALYRAFSKRPSSKAFVAIQDRFETLEEVQAELRRNGLESSQLIICIDATKSNTWTGAKSFGGRCLHDVQGGTPNPYQETISIVGRTLSAFDDDNLIPAFIFGDSTTGDR